MKLASTPHDISVSPRNKRRTSGANWHHAPLGGSSNRRGRLRRPCIARRI